MKVYGGVWMCMKGYEVYEAVWRGMKAYENI